jgi:diguanylate cyclase (GGDEF)-like protein/PAS domain S-box-containing protein
MRLARLFTIAPSVSGVRRSSALAALGGGVLTLTAALPVAAASGALDSVLHGLKALAANPWQLGAGLLVLSIGAVAVQRKRHPPVPDDRRQLELAIDSMPQGLLLFDAAGRLVLCNRRYIDMYGLSTDVVKPGCSLRDILDHRKETGSFVGDVHAYHSAFMQDITDGKATEDVVGTSDGRFVRIKNLPLAGGGWVCTHEDVTAQQLMARARHEAEQSLREQKLKLDAALNNMTSGLAMFDPNCRIVMLNRRYVEMMELPADDLMGISLLDLFKIRKASGKLQGDPEEVFANILADVRSGKTTVKIMRASDGRLLRVVDQPLPDGSWVATFEDITEQRRLEEERDRNGEFLKLIIDSVPMTIVVKDAKTRRFLLANRAAGAFWGYSNIEAIGKTAHDLFPPAQAEMIDRTDDQAIQADGPITIDAHPNISHQGQIRIVVSKRLSVRGADGEPKYLISVVEDVTERKALETERDNDRKFLRQIIDNVPISIMVRDVETNRYALINQEAERHLGRSRDSIIGKRLDDVWPAQTAATIKARDEKFWQSGGNLMVDEHAIKAPGRGDRTVISKRLAIRDNAGKPQYMVNLVEDVTERKRTDDRIAHLAHFDALTELPNRVLFREQLEAALHRLGDGGSLAVIYLDLDHFKDINDTLGHSVGDELLKAVAGRLRACVHDASIASRLGGDEFAIMYGPTRDRNDVVTLVKVVQEAIRAPFEFCEYRLTVDSSIGIAMVPDNGTEVDQILKCADLAMYEAKAAGRGTFRFFEPAMDSKLKARRKLEFAMREAIMTDGFELHYQPIYNIQTGRITACEALLRWNDPKLGTISPAEFIPIAEETGLIVQLGAWVLRTACAEAVSWPDGVKLAVNISPVQFSNANIVQTVINALAATRFPANRLELEITEAVLLRDDDSALAVLLQLQALGIKVAMDDFGTGYSSLGYLQRFPFDKIKVDRSFIKEIESGDSSLVIVQSIVNIANSRGIVTTAEGVETERQRELLEKCGCTELQGYLFSPPVAAAELRNLLAAPYGTAQAVA